MNLKDAGRYSKYLSGLISQLGYFLYDKRNLFTIEELHKKKEANKEAENEVKDATPIRNYNINNNDLAYLVQSIIQERLNLSLAIEEAKRSIQLEWQEDGKNLTLDSAIEYNKSLRNLAKDYLESMNALSDSVSNDFGFDYKFNAEGNQVSYKYPVEITKKLDFDKAAIYDLYKNILIKTDEISNQIDEAKTRDIIAFTPNYSVHDSLEEVINQYSKRLES